MVLRAWFQNKQKHFAYSILLLKLILFLDSFLHQETNCWRVCAEKLSLQHNHSFEMAPFSQPSIRQETTTNYIQEANLQLFSAPSISGVSIMSSCLLHLNVSDGCRISILGSTGSVEPQGYDWHHFGQRIKGVFRWSEERMLVFGSYGVT